MALTFPLQDEVEGLTRENEELKTKNQHLESQLKTALDPCSINTVTTGDNRVDSYILDELKNKLRAATDVCEEVKQDMDKLKEVYSLYLMISILDSVVITYLVCHLCLCRLK